MARLVPVTMLTHWAGPDGCHRAGETVEVSADVAELLIGQRSAAPAAADAVVKPTAKDRRKPRGGKKAERAVTTLDPISKADVAEQAREAAAQAGAQTELQEEGATT